MIGRLRGTVVGVETDRALVEVGGVGYEVAMTAKSLAGLRVDEPTTVHTHLQVREDDMSLYGFAARSERDLFRVLLSVSGVGPKVALAVLSVFAPDALRVAIATEDVDALTQVPGIGKRGAQKILLDLKPRLADLEADVLDGGGTGGTMRQALEALGYSSSEIRSVRRDVDAGASVEEQIRQALRLLGQERAR